MDTAYRLLALRSVSKRSINQGIMGALYESWRIEKECNSLVHNEMKKIRDTGDYGVM